MLARSTALAATLLVCSTACSSGSEPSKQPLAPSAAAGKPSPRRGMGFDRFAHKWSVKTAGDVKDILFAPSGDVLTVGGAYVRVFGREEGKELRAAGIGCGPTAGSATFDSKLGIVVVCSSEVRHVTWPGLTSEPLKQFEDVILTAAFTDRDVIVQATTQQALTSKGLVATVRVLDRKSLEKTADLPMPHPVAMTLSALPSGLVVAMFQDGISLREPGTTKWRPLVKGSVPSVAVPSPDGREVFLNPRPNETVTVEIASARITRTWRGASPRAAAWVGNDAIATAGPWKGLRLLEIAGTEIVSGDEVAFDLVAGSGDGKTLCAHSSEARTLACYFDAAPPGVAPAKTAPAGSAAPRR